MYTHVKSRIIGSVNSIEPSDGAKERMLANIRNKAEMQAAFTEKPVEFVKRAKPVKTEIHAPEARRSRPVWTSKKIIVAAAAAALLVCALAAIIPLSQRPPENAEKQNTVEPANPQNPQYIESFTAPELQKLYQTEPYSELLPNIIPPDLSFKSSFLTGADAVSNPDGRMFLALVFASEYNNLEIKISEYDGTGQIADPKKPETYMLESYYGPIENDGALGANLPNVFVPFNAFDVTREIASARIYTFKDGICKAEIDMICDKYLVSYVYTGKPIDGDLFFDCVTSSFFFDKAEQKDGENALEKNDEGIPPQYVPAYAVPTLDEVYAAAPYSELLPKRLLPGCSFVDSYLTEYDPIVNPEGRKFLALIFKTGNESWDTMEIKVGEYDGTSLFADINDKRTYALSYLYGDNAVLPGRDLPYFSELFHSEDITNEIAKEMVYTASDGLCKAEISVLCGDHIVSYGYTGPEITAEAFYDMILSSDWFSA